MRWPLITRRHHEQALAHQQRGYGIALDEADTNYKRLAAAHQELKRQADHLQSLLDDALGLNTSAVTFGASWQDRRETKLRFDK